MLFPFDRVHDPLNPPKPPPSTHPFPPPLGDLPPPPDGNALVGITACDHVGRSVDKKWELALLLGPFVDYPGLCWGCCCLAVHLHRQMGACAVGAGFIPSH